MNIALATLVAAVQLDAPARSGVPTAPQYEQLVKDAVRDFSRRVSMTRRHALSIVTGTAAYDLPEDFQKLIRLETQLYPDNVIVNDTLIPVATTYEETFVINGLTLTFSPTPTYTTTRYLVYAAGHVLSSGAYPYMTEDDAEIVRIKAVEKVLRTQARAAAIDGEMVEYQIGDERVKKVSASTSLNAAADKAASDYDAAILERIGPVGMRSNYNELGR